MTSLTSHKIKLLTRLYHAYQADHLGWIIVERKPNGNMLSDLIIEDLLVWSPGPPDMRLRITSRGLKRIEKHVNPPHRRIHAEIIRRVQAGDAYSQIAQDTGYTYYYISKIANRNGLRRKKAQTHAKDTEILGLIEKGLSKHEIAIQVDCSLHHVYTVMRRNKIPSIRSLRPKKVTIARQLHKQGLNADQISRHLHCSHSTVYSYLSESQS